LCYNGSISYSDWIDFKSASNAIAHLKSICDKKAKHSGLLINKLIGTTCLDQSFEAAYEGSLIKILLQKADKP